MTDLHARLAENEAIIREGTPGALEIVQGHPAYDFYDLHDPEGNVVFQDISEEDAALVLRARQDWPKMNAALRKVLELVDNTLENVRLYREQHLSSEGDDIQEGYANLIREAIEEAMSDDH